MISRLLVILALTSTLLTQSCGAKSQDAVENDILLNSTNKSIAEKALYDFSSALTNKDLKLLIKIADPDNIHLVRLFTSGNLGGRGASLDKIISTSNLNKNLAFNIEGQTPFELPELFINLPIKSINTLSNRTLSSEAETIDFGRWEPILKKSLQGAPEAINGDSLLLVSSSSKYWVYTEAQIIDDILVGEFAVFTMRDNKLLLVSIIALL